MRTVFIIKASLPDKITPVGIIEEYIAEKEIPEGWLLCDGRELSSKDYSELFDVLGYIYGAGDRTNTFNLPNLTGSV